MDIYTLTSYLAENLEFIKGKKAYQKLVYFSKAIGIPLNESYKLYYYGPYSQQVADELEECLNYGILDKSEEAFYFNAGIKSKEVLEKNKKDIYAYKERLEKIIKTFGECDPMELEILATVHFIYNNMNFIYGMNDRKVIIEEVKKIKSPKFSDTEIQDAYKKLLKNGYLN